MTMGTPPPSSFLEPDNHAGSETPTPLFQVSLSAFQSFLQCEQKYYYGYVRRLRQRESFAAPALGRMLHDYLENYYRGIKDGITAQDAHTIAQLATSNKYVKELRGYAQVAYYGGNEKLAHELGSLPALAGRLSERYFAARGAADADRYDILMVENRINLNLTPTIRSNGVVDLVTEDRETGRISIWEHKSTGNVPEQGVRLRDFQTLLYSVKLRTNHELTIDSIIWNYLRTKEPTAPDVLKNGHMTKRENLDSTWETYKSVADAHMVDVETPEYDEVRGRLWTREKTIFFPRYEVVTVASEGLLMGDYITVAQRMQEQVSSWNEGKSLPVHTFSRMCDTCEFNRVCLASVTGGDPEDVIQLRYTSGKSN